MRLCLSFSLPSFRFVMLKKAYDWMVSYSNHPKAIYVLAIVSFLESFISPIPPLPLLISMCLANPRRAWWIAMVCAGSSVIGGYAGYAIGALLYDTLGLWIINLYNLQDKAAAMQQTASNAWIYVLMTKGVTPIPFKIVTILSGFIHYSLIWFTLGSIVARFTFYGLVAVALHFYGEQVRDFIEKRLKLVAFGLLAVIVGGFLIIPHLL